MSTPNTEFEANLRSLLNELTHLIPKLGVKRASSFNRDLRVIKMTLKIRTLQSLVALSRKTEMNVAICTIYTLFLEYFKV